MKKKTAWRHWVNPRREFSFPYWFRCVHLYAVQKKIWDGGITYGLENKRVELIDMNILIECRVRLSRQLWNEFILCILPCCDWPPLLNFFLFVLLSVECVCFFTFYSSLFFAANLFYSHFFLPTLHFTCFILSPTLFECAYYNWKTSKYKFWCWTRKTNWEVEKVESILEKVRIWPATRLKFVLWFRYKLNRQTPLASKNVKAFLYQILKNTKRR